MYNLDNPGRGIQDCPKCRFTMQRLKEHNSLARNEGYMIDDGTGDRSMVTSLLFGWYGLLIRFVYRNVVYPLMLKTIGDVRQKRQNAIVREFPHALICTHCDYILKRK